MYPITITPLIKTALNVAVIAHNGQTRKDSREPYLCHPLRVAEIVSNHGGGAIEIAVALTHDVIEDSSDGEALMDVFFEQKVFDERIYGSFVVRLVKELTNDKTLGNRAERKAAEVEHAYNMNPIAKMVRLADILDNFNSIGDLKDPEFVNLYTREKRKLWHALDGSKSDKLYLAVWRKLFTIAPPEKRSIHHDTEI